MDVSFEPETDRGTVYIVRTKRCCRWSPVLDAELAYRARDSRMAISAVSTAPAGTMPGTPRSPYAR